MKTNLMKRVLFGWFSFLLLTGCHKAVDELLNQKTETTAPAKNTVTTYVIKQGQHYCEQGSFQPVETDELRFTVTFDSSAIYQTVDPVNQYDINKLYGFSDNNANHQQFSARFGWGWSDGAIRLYAYIYNNGVRSSKELGVIAIGQEVTCSISVTANSYVFTMNDHVLTMPRLSTTPKAKGYLLYPYFGGDETAPHAINIRIKNS